MDDNALYCDEECKLTGFYLGLIDIELESIDLLLGVLYKKPMFSIDSSILRIALKMLNGEFGVPYREIYAIEDRDEYQIMYNANGIAMSGLNNLNESQEEKRGIVVVRLKNLIDTVEYHKGVGFFNVIK